MPVPGPTRMQGKLGSGGSRKEGALAERHFVRPLASPLPILTTCAGWREENSASVGNGVTVLSSAMTVSSS